MCVCVCVCVCVCASVKKIFGVESLNLWKSVLSFYLSEFLEILFLDVYFKPMIDPVDEKDPNSGNCGIQKS